MRNTYITSFLLVVLVLVSSSAFGHGGGGDIALFATNGQVDVGFAILDDNDINQVFFDGNDRVFSSVLVPQVLFGFSMGSTEPGFDADEGTLPQSASLTVATKSVRYWDGTGDVVFAAATDVSGRFEPSTMQTDSEGGFHAHPLFGLGGSVADGVYLTEFTVGAEGLETSESFFLVALVDDTIKSHADPETAGEELGELVRDYQSDLSQTPMYANKDFSFFGDAVLRVESQIAPEPASYSLAVLSVLVLAGLRKSNRNAVRSESRRSEGRSFE